MASSTGSQTPRPTSPLHVLHGEELVRSIKQLLNQCSRFLKEAGSVEAAEEAILHMEEHDANFHRYDFVKRLRSQIDAYLGALIDEQLEDSNMPASDPVAGHETLVSKITDRVLYSAEYQNFKLSMKNNIAEACQFLLNNFESEFTVEGSDKSTVGQCRPKPDFSDGESSLDDSSLNHSSVMFMNNEDFRKIAEALETRKPLDLRKDTVRRLMSIATVDIANCESWPRIRHALQDALGDQDPQLWTISLKLLARTLPVNHHNTSKEIYTALVQHLALQFQSRNRNTVPKLRNGLDSNRTEHVKLLKIFRLINQFQRQVPQYWIRYPEKFVEELLDSTISLLAIHHHTTVATPAYMTPIHFLALLDIKANWFITWMHGHYSRSILLKILLKHRAIVDNAVRSCIEYVAAHKVPFDLVSEASEAPSSSSSGAISRRLHYAGHELEFAYFMHSLCLLGRLLLHEQGRSFFPIKLKERDEPVTVTTLIVILIQLLIEPASPSLHSPYTAMMQLDPCVIVCDVIKKLCTSEQVCQKCVCKDRVTDTLLAPISLWMDGPAESVMPSEITLLQVADLLSAVASTSSGRQHLLYGELHTSAGKRFSKTKSSPAHILAEFAKRALSNDLPPGVGQPAKGVVGNLVFVCRQLYTMCEGLAIMSSYDLHHAIAAVWRLAMKEADLASTPTPSIDGRGPSMNRMSQYIALWEDTLRDNLLNFAATPKGVLLLQQTGAMNECVAYLYSRYVSKLQVSKCEKFGYGYMLSQVAASAPGIKALQQTGFIRSLVQSIWGALEVANDSPPYSPKSWPVLILDKSVRKYFGNMVNLMSTFLAANEVLGGCSLPTKEKYSLREMPDSLPGLFDRLVMVDTEEKIRSLFNYEQSHVFGLRLLSLMTSCLDTFLMLQTQFNIQAMLLQGQAQNVASEGSKQILIDMLSMERNYILVKTYLVGGPTERLIPPHSLDELTGGLKYPLFSTLPVPTEYTPKSSSKIVMKQDTELSKFLAESKKSSLDAAWLEKCRKSFCSLLTTKPESARGNVLQDLMERCLQVKSQLPEEAIFPQLQYTASDAVVKTLQLTTSQQLGIDMTVRYGQSIKLITVTAKEGREKLAYLVKKCTYYLEQQQKPAQTYATKLHCFGGTAPGYDWFVASIYLMMAGNGERAWKFLYKFSTLAASAYLWTHRLHCSVHLPQSLMLSAIPPVFSATCHNVELILQSEVSHVYSAFKMSGFSPAQICQHWIRQCFWNYLDWLDICHYVCVCMSLGVDYQVYICVAILKHQQLRVLTHSQNKDLIVFLKEEPIHGFRIGDHLEYMRELENKYRKTVLPDMLNTSKP